MIRQHTEILDKFCKPQTPHGAAARGVRGREVVANIGEVLYLLFVGWVIITLIAVM